MEKVLRAYAFSLTALGTLGGIVFAAMAVMISLDVVLRNLGISSFPWLLEIVEYALFIVTVMVAPWVLHKGSHVRVDVLVGALPGHRPGGFWTCSATPSAPSAARSCSGTARGSPSRPMGGKN